MIITGQLLQLVGHALLSEIDVAGRAHPVGYAVVISELLCGPSFGVDETSGRMRAEAGALLQKVVHLAIESPGECQWCRECCVLCSKLAQHCGMLSADSDVPLVLLRDIQEADRLHLRILEVPQVLSHV